MKSKNTQAYLAALTEPERELISRIQKWCSDNDRKPSFIFRKYGINQNVGYQALTGNKKYLTKRKISMFSRIISELEK